MADDTTLDDDPRSNDQETGQFSVDWSRHWILEGGVDFLNHGSFGACPKRVLKEQSELRKQMERQPVRFFDREFLPLLDRARAELAAFVGCDTDGLVFVPNATTGVNAVLRSRAFDPGDELLVTNHAYPACRKALEFVAERSGASVRVVDLPFPTGGPDEIVETVLEAMTPKTELALLDHVTSQTGLIMPVERLCEELSDRHVDVLVDGAHAPGMIDLHINELAEAGCTYYTGNCHKWMCAPKGAAFLWVEPYEREDVHPVTISNWYGEPANDRSQLHMEFDWTGTDDPSAWLSVPTAIDFMGQLLPGGWCGLKERNWKLALEARDLLCEALDIEAPAPDQMLGSLAAVPLPDRSEDQSPDSYGRDPLEVQLSEEYGFEVPVKSWPQEPGRVLRISAQLYNYREQYERLTDALVELLDRR